MHLSLSETATRLGQGWDKARLSRVENNQLPLTRNTIHQIAAVLEIRPEKLLLMCLKENYPRLQDSRVGQLLDEIATILSQD
jgi:transcriptional regulator with XRE-family HTH domain